MLQKVGGGYDSQALSPPAPLIGKAGFAALVAALETALIVSASILCGIAYHLLAYQETGPVGEFALAGLLVAVLFVSSFAFRGDYRVDRFLDGRRDPARLLKVWVYAIVAVTVVGFLAKASGTLSRGWFLLFFAAGLAAVIGLDSALQHYAAKAVQAGWIEPRRLLIIGDTDHLDRLVDLEKSDHGAIAVMSTINLPALQAREAMSAEALKPALSQAIELGRAGNVSDVVVLVDPSHDDLLTQIADGLLDLPAAIHLGGWRMFERFPGLSSERIGPISTMTLVRPPLGTFEQLSKRWFDFAAALAALVIASPVLLIAALAIKLDSQGPVFFRQRRRGYNHKEFRIWKLRTMTTMDDGETIDQATADDPRVTRVGGFLRRTNIDELPQLINVVMGEMSMVGPRPHAVAHDRRYEQVIERYARRLNVKPGITGWAQVNGLRGPTRTEDDMHQRIVHDLYYIDNWSIAFDVLILLMTVASPRAYKNAF